MAEYNLDDAIRKVPDFPKPGILFYDITSVLADPVAFSYCIEKMKELYKDKGITAVAGVEARGFLFAAPFAKEMGLPLILIRKKGKLPGNTLSASFALEYGEDIVEIHPHDVPEGANILMVDDLIATGGTLEAAAGLIREAGGHVDEIFGVVGLPFLGYGEILEGYKLTTLIEYEGE